MYMSSAVVCFGIDTTVGLLQPVKPEDQGWRYHYFPYVLKGTVTTHRVVKIIRKADNLLFCAGLANEVNNPFVVPDKNVVG